MPTKKVVPLKTTLKIEDVPATFYKRFQKVAKEAGLSEDELLVEAFKAYVAQNSDKGKKK